MNTHIWNADNGDGTYSNPILYADYSDPDAIRVGEDYYMIASSFCNAPGLPVLHSKDLVNWELINYVLPKLPEARYDNPVHGCGVWAPSIRYHEGIYYVCFPMPDEGIYMSTASDPYGEWSEPVNIRPGAGWIDPCPFWDEDGRAYLVAGVAKSRIGYKSVLHMVEMRPDGMGLIGDEIKIFDGNENDQETIEGPKMYKRNGWYYIFAPAGGVKTGWQTVLRSRNVYGPYEYRVVMRQGDSPVNGPHQGAWVDTVTGEDWFLHFQDVYAAGRITHLQPMHWEDDWPVIGIAKEGEIYGEPVLRYRKPDVGRTSEQKAAEAYRTESNQEQDAAVGSMQERMEPATSDDFTGSRLGLQWQWNANPQEGWYHLKAQEGQSGLVLKAVKKESAYGDVSNLLLQKWPAPEFSCTTTLFLNNLKVGDEAGVISLGMDYGVVTFVRTENAIQVRSIRGHQVFEKILVDHTEEECTIVDELPADTQKVHVLYQVKADGLRDLSEKEKGFPKETVHISYSLDREAYREVCTMDSVPGRWVGVKVGVFCLSEKDNSQGSVEAEAFLLS